MGDSNSENTILEFTDNVNDSIHNSKCIFAVFIKLFNPFGTVNPYTLLRQFKHIRVESRVFDQFMKSLNGG